MSDSIPSEHPLADVSAVVRSRSVAGKALRFLLPTLLSAALVTSAQPALAQFRQRPSRSKRLCHDNRSVFAFDQANLTT